MRGTVCCVFLLFLIVASGCRPRQVTGTTSADKAITDKPTTVTKKDKVWPSIPTLSPEAAQHRADELILLAKDNRTDFATEASPIIDDLLRAKQGALAVPGLVEILQSDDNALRLRAAKGVWLLASQAEAAIPALLTALEDDDFMLRQEVIRALGRVCWSDNGPPPADTPKVVRALISCLSEGSGEEKDRNNNRLHACQALSNIGPAAAEAVPEIIPLLKDKQGAARSNACLALAHIKGPAAMEAIPILQELATSDPVPEVRTNANFALNKLKKS
jgi:HEAT repeat protein